MNFISFIFFSEGRGVMGMLNCARESNNGTIAQLIVRGKVSKVKCTFLKSVRGKKCSKGSMEFGLGENEKRENDLSG